LVFIRERYPRSIHPFRVAHFIKHSNELGASDGHMKIDLSPSAKPAG
jgi:hypothetical protein